MPRRRLILSRCLRLQCPRCGQGRLFAHGLTLFERCPVCSLSFEPEQGYYVGAIYLNYAATVIVATPGFLVLDYWTDWSLTHQLLVWGAFAISFPILCFRHSKSLWLSLDYCLTRSPEDGEQSHITRS